MIPGKLVSVYMYSLARMVGAAACLGDVASLFIPALGSIMGTYSMYFINNLCQRRVMWSAGV